MDHVSWIISLFWFWFWTGFITAEEVVVTDPELKLETTDGENVTITLETAELDRAEQVKVTFTGEHVKNVLIAQYCRCAHCGDCNAKRQPGVLLQVEERKLILQHVSSNNSGLYEVQVIGEKVYEKNVILVVKNPALSLTKVPPHTSTPKPPNSSDHKWLYALLILPVILVVVMYFFWRKRCKSPCIFKKSNRKRNCSDCAAVSLKTCRGDSEDQLMDT